MADSPRWCSHCNAWGDHHSDRCREHVHGTLPTPLDDAINAGSTGPVRPDVDTSWWDADVPQGGPDPLVGYVNGKFDRGEWT